MTRGFAKGDTVTATFAYRMRMVDPAGRDVDATSGAQNIARAALYCGPWLMAVDERIDRDFFGEPWPNNVVWLAASPVPIASGPGRIRVRAEYEHEGFAGRLPVTLRTMGETPADEQKTLAWVLNYRRG